jgi:hypothetical protein
MFHANRQTCDGILHRRPVRPVRLLGGDLLKVVDYGGQLGGAQVPEIGTFDQMPQFVERALLGIAIMRARFAVNQVAAPLAPALVEIRPGSRQRMQNRGSCKRSPARGTTSSFSSFLRRGLDSKSASPALTWL